MTFKCIEFGDKEFTSKEAMFDALLFNSAHIIDVKMKTVQKSCEKGNGGILTLLKEEDTAKAPFEMKEGYIYPVINTTRYMDSHKDVHFDNLWKQSLVEEEGKIAYVLDHRLGIETMIAWPEDVKSFAKNVPWSFVGKSYSGNTQALIYEIRKESIDNPTALKVIAGKRPVQNSVRMQYGEVILGINDKRPEFKDQKAYFDEMIDTIANKDVVLKDGYFWGVPKAFIREEGSMVLRGSNDATPINYFEAEKAVFEIEPPISTQKTIIDYLAKIKR
jgi:hypothetical protein